MTYRQPETCPRCGGRVMLPWLEAYPKCLDCGWEDYSRPLRSVSVGTQIPLADDFETERLMFNEPEEVSQWQPGAHAADCGCGPCQAVASTVAALIHDGIRERLDRLGGALDALVAKARRGDDKEMQCPSGGRTMSHDPRGVTGRRSATVTVPDISEANRRTR